MTQDILTGFIATASQARHESIEIIRNFGDHQESLNDTISIEEPLEIRIAGPDFDETTLTITMRTPGQDHELSLGFIYSEGIISTLDDVADVEHCRPPSIERGIHNAICITLAPHVSFNQDQLRRNFYTNSGCGVCGKTSIESVLAKPALPLKNEFSISSMQIKQLPVCLRELQTEFPITGGIHAAGLINNEGRIVMVREDIGRHNAIDKLIGAKLLADELPLKTEGLMLSGRAGFELVQKAVMAGAEFLSAIGPPSSLSISLAKEAGMTLAGFANDRGFNLYTHPQRIS